MLKYCLFVFPMLAFSMENEDHERLSTMKKIKESHLAGSLHIPAWGDVRLSNDDVATTKSGGKLLRLDLEKSGNTPKLTLGGQVDAIERWSNYRSPEFRRGYVPKSEQTYSYYPETASKPQTISSSNEWVQNIPSRKENPCTITSSEEFKRHNEHIKAELYFDHLKRHAENTQDEQYLKALLLTPSSVGKDNTTRQRARQQFRKTIFQNISVINEQYNETEVEFDCPHDQIIQTRKNKKKKCCKRDACNIF